MPGCSPASYLGSWVAALVTGVSSALGHVLSAHFLLGLRCASSGKTNFGSGKQVPPGLMSLPHLTFRPSYCVPNFLCPGCHLFVGRGMFF